MIQKHILFETERLIIRRPEEKDLHLFKAVFCDAEMMRYLGGAMKSEQAEDALREWQRDWGLKNRWQGVLMRKDKQEAIGTAGITEDTLPDEPGCEISWFVLPEYQGQGYASEITAELLRFGFAELKTKRLLAETHPDNPAANRVLEKLGFEFMGEQQHNYDFLPDFDRQNFWVLSKENWAKRKY